MDMLEEKYFVSNCINVVCILVSQFTPISNRIRMIIAKKSPNCINFLRFSMGNRSDKIEMKIMLSIPKTISKKVRVIKATTISGVIMRYFIF